MGAAAHVGGWFLAPPPSLVKFRAWVCKTAGPLECEKNSPIRILRFQRRARPSVLFPARRPQQAPGATRETAGASAAGPVLSVLSPTRRPQRAPEAAKETAGATAAGPVLSALPPARGPQQPPRSHRGDHRCHRCRAGLPVLPPTRGPQQAQGAARETAETSAAGPCLHSPLPGGRSRPQKPPGRPQRPPPPGRSACPLPCQGAAAGPRSRQGNRRDLRRRAGYFQCQEGL